jgi:hypothetical protein
MNAGQDIGPQLSFQARADPRQGNRRIIDKVEELPSRWFAWIITRKQHHRGSRSSYLNLVTGIAQERQISRFRIRERRDPTDLPIRHSFLRHESNHSAQFTHTKGYLHV